VLVGDPNERFQRLLAGDGELGLSPPIDRIDLAPAELVAVLEVRRLHSRGALGVAVVDHLVGRFDVDRPAILRDDGDGDPDELAEPDRVRKGLPGRDDDCRVPLAQRIEETDDDILPEDRMYM
jgi:hypothetical protein